MDKNTTLNDLFDQLLLLPRFKDYSNEKKEELKTKVSEIKDKLKSNQEEIDGVSGNESEESDKHNKLAELKTERGKLYSELIKAKEAFIG